MYHAVQFRAQIYPQSPPRSERGFDERGFDKGALLVPIRSFVCTWKRASPISTSERVDLMCAQLCSARSGTNAPRRQYCFPVPVPHVCTEIRPAYRVAVLAPHTRGTARN
eukprot:3823916-Rhodomonas_salina.1